MTTAASEAAAPTNLKAITRNIEKTKTLGKGPAAKLKKIEKDPQ